MTRRDESIDRLAHARSEVVQECHDRLTLNDRRFVERYLESVLDLAFRLRVESEEFVAFVHRSDVARSQVDAHSGDVHGRIGRAFDGECVDDFLERGDGGKQEAVLIHDVKLVETPVGAVPSLVRFQLFKRGRCGGSDSRLYFGQAGFKFVRVSRDGKLVVAGNQLVVVDDELAVKEIERRTEVVEGVPNKQADRLLRRRDALVKAADTFAR